MGLLLIPSAGLGFFFASWIVMIFWGIVAPTVGLQTISYITSMVVTIALWLAVAPLFGAMMRREWRARMWWRRKVKEMPTA